MVYLDKTWKILEKYQLIDSEDSLDTVVYVILKVVRLFLLKLDYPKKNYMYKIMLAFKQIDDR